MKISLKKRTYQSVRNRLYLQSYGFFNFFVVFVFVVVLLVVVVVVAWQMTGFADVVLESIICRDRGEKPC